MGKRKAKLTKVERRRALRKAIHDLAPIVLLFLFLVILAGVATVQKLASIQDATVVSVTGAAVIDLSEGRMSIAAVSLLLFLVFFGGGMLGLGSYFIVQINKNSHIKFMVKETFVDLGKAMLPHRRKK
jgi:hypothetical protein